MARAITKNQLKRSCPSSRRRFLIKTISRSCQVVADTPDTFPNIIARYSEARIRTHFNNTSETVEEAELIAV